MDDIFKVGRTGYVESDCARLSYKEAADELTAMEPHLDGFSVVGKTAYEIAISALKEIDEFIKRKENVSGRIEEEIKEIENQREIDSYNGVDTIGSLGVISGLKLALKIINSTD